MGEPAVKSEIGEIENTSTNSSYVLLSSVFKGVYFIL